MCGSLRILTWLFLHVSSQIILLNSFISLLLACFLHLFAISLLAYASSPISFIWDQFHMSVLGFFVLFFSLPQNSHCLPKISVRRISSGRQSPFVLPVCGHWSLPSLLWPIHLNKWHETPLPVRKPQRHCFTAAGSIYLGYFLLQRISSHAPAFQSRKTN